MRCAYPIVAIAAVLLGGCGSKPAKHEPPVTPKPSEAHPVTASPDVSAPAPPPKPKIVVPASRAGLLVYNLLKRQDARTTLGYGPLSLIPAEGDARAVVVEEEALDVVVGPHVIAGRHFQSNKFWTADLRTPAIEIRPAEPTTYITPDDRLVWPCSSGSGEPFAICISDADGSNKRELLREPARPDIGVLGGASTTHVFGYYLGKAAVAKPFMISIADGKRTELAFTAPKGDDIFRPIFSADGTVLADCVSTPKGQVFAFADTKPGSKTRTVNWGASPNCACIVAADATTAACSLVTAGEGKAGVSKLVAIDLKSGRTTLLSTVPTFELVFSPDGKRVAFLAIEETKEVLRVVSIDGKTNVDVTSFPDQSVRLLGWTQATGP